MPAGCLLPDTLRNGEWWNINVQSVFYSSVIRPTWKVVEGLFVVIFAPVHVIDFIAAFSCIYTC